MGQHKLFSVPVIPLTQKVGTYYLTSIPWRQLVEISFTDVRRMEDSTTEIEEYIGIQRKLDQKRLVEIENYLRTADASFPTSIVIAVDDPRCAQLAADRRELTFYSVDSEDESSVEAQNIARIIDGQHRVAGLRKANLPSEFDLAVTVFVGLDMAEQAYIFATVNLAQTKVNRSLVADLSSYSRSRNPEKTCHFVAVTLNAGDKSPLHHAIKRLGSATPGVAGETLTQATFVDALIPYITRDKLRDRDEMKRGFLIPPANANEFQATPFRNLFLANRDEIIAAIVWNYFDSIAQRWPMAWASSDRGIMLKRTNGFRAFMKVLGRAYLALGGNDVKQPRSPEFASLWLFSKLRDEDFTVDRFHPGTSGERALVRELESAIAIYRTRSGAILR